MSLLVLKKVVGYSHCSLYLPKSTIHVDTIGQNNTFEILEHIITRKMGTRVRNFALEDSQIAEIGQLLDEIMGGRDSIELLPFLELAHIFAQELPRSIRKAFYEFKTFEDTGILIVKNNLIDENRFGLTPPALPMKDVELLQREEVLHILYCSLLGEPFGWSSIQRGNVINEVFAVKENATLNVSSGSKLYLGLHTEDAFDDNYGEFLGLMCIRNTYKTPTQFSYIEEAELPELVKKTLFEKRFKIASNPAHHIRKIEKKSAILSGDYNSPYLRVNFNFIENQAEGDAEAEYALRELLRIMEENSFAISLEKGDYVYIDNLKVAHGRKPFTPMFDGKDRWMKRVYITSSLKKSRVLRNGALGRTIYPQNNDLESSLRSKI